MCNSKGAKAHRLRTTVIGNENAEPHLSLNRLVSLLMDVGFLLAAVNTTTTSFDTEAFL